MSIPRQALLTGVAAGALGAMAAAGWWAWTGRPGTAAGPASAAAEAGAPAAAVRAAAAWVFAGHTAPVTSVALSRDGSRALSGGGKGDCAVRVWDTVRRAQVGRFAGHGTACEVLVVAFGDSEDVVISAAGPDDYALRAWEASAGRERHQLSGDEGLLFRAVAPDGAHALGQEADTGGRSRGFSVWSLATGTRVARVSAPEQASALAFSPDGATVLSGGDNGSLTLWNAATGARLRSFKGHGANGAVRTVAGSSARLLASTAADGQVVLWDPETGVPFRTVADATLFALADDGRTLAVAGQAAGIRVIDAITGHTRATLEGHDGAVTALAFAPGAERLVSGGHDGTVRVWILGR